MESLKKISPKWYVLIVCGLLYLISLTQPAISYTDYEGNQSFSGIKLLGMGGIGILGGGLLEWFIWLANPLFVVSLILFIKEHKKAFYLSLIPVFLAIRFSFWDELLVSGNGRNEDIDSLNLGFYLWTASFIILAIANFYWLIKKRTHNRVDGSAHN